MFYNCLITIILQEPSSFNGILRENMLKLHLANIKDLIKWKATGILRKLQI